MTKLNEIEKIVTDTACVHAFGWNDQITAKLRRRLRALVRKAFMDGELHVEWNTREEREKLKLKYGFKL
jgi:hypothetical protein